MSRRLLVAGNWKQNGSVAGTLALTAAIAEGLLEDAAEAGAAANEPGSNEPGSNEPGSEGRHDVIGAEYLVCPTYLHLAAVAERVRQACAQAKTLADSQVGGSVALPLNVGSQDCGIHPDGAFTGNIGAEMLLDAGCRYTIVGHSERRQLFGDTDETVARKFGAAQSAGLTPVLCVGETLQEREKGMLEEVVFRQLDAVLTSVWQIKEATDEALRPVIAYEPVWAIGTGKTASPEEAQDVHRLIRSRLADISGSAAESTRIVYGGSVKPDNAAELFAQPDIDGGLIGGASLKASDFLSIGRAADQLMRNGI